VTRRRLFAGLAAAAALAAAWAVTDAIRAPPAALARARSGRADTAADGVQTLELRSEAGEYRPNVVHARAGAPLRLRVVVRDRSACATRLLVPDLGVDLALVAGGAAEIVLPPAPAGSYVFTCAQKMVKGVLVLE
jgi:plastocyanin domain-containing protein